MPEGATKSAASRRTVIAATAVLKALGHSGLTSFLLEHNLPDQVSNTSGLKARAVALAEHILKNPDVVSAEGVPAAQAVVQRALQIVQGSEGKSLSEAERTEFESAAQRDGLMPVAAEEVVLGGETNRNASTDASPNISGRPLDQLRKATAPSPTEPVPRQRRVFIVHGHDDAARHAVARFLEKIGFEAIILHEQVNKGRTIIAKFREEAAKIGFAVVLMTPDDHGGKVGAETKLRARQNVVFELGFFIGSLGPERVAALVKGTVETPSDYSGVAYTDWDDAGAWKQSLARELYAAGFDIDWQKAMAG
jgi:predicted nucleotide-binding protein